jgi:hypothetical protein
MKIVQNNRKILQWDYVNVESFTKEHLKHYNVEDLRKMFLRTDYPMVPELAYFTFLLFSPWGLEFDYKSGVDRIRTDLRLPLFEGDGLSFTHRKLNPVKIWATQDSLDTGRLEMIRTAFEYMLDHKKPIPPVAVWLIKNSSRYNFVAHDGHHRIYVANQMKMKIPTILLEYWIDNRETSLLQQKLHYHQHDMYVKDMPIVKFKKIKRKEKKSKEKKDKT